MPNDRQFKTSYDYIRQLSQGWYLLVAEIYLALAELFITIPLEDKEYIRVLFI